MSYTVIPLFVFMIIYKKVIFICMQKTLKRVAHTGKTIFYQRNSENYTGRNERYSAAGLLPDKI